MMIHIQYANSNGRIDNKPVVNGATFEELVAESLANGYEDNDATQPLGARVWKGSKQNGLTVQFVTIREE